MGMYYQKTVGLLANPRLYSTVRVSLVEMESNEVIEALYDEAAQYCEDIVREMAAYQTAEYPTNNLMQYFKIPDDRKMEERLKQKIQAARPTVHAVGKSLYAALDLELSADLTVDEFTSFVHQIQLQYKDGWGAEFELHNIETTGTDAVCLRLYHREMDFYTADAFDQLIQQKEEQVPESLSTMEQNNGI